MILEPDFYGYQKVGFCFTKISEVYGYITYTFNGNFGYTLLGDGATSCPNIFASTSVGPLVAGRAYNYSISASFGGRIFTNSVSFTASVSTQTATTQTDTQTATTQTATTQTATKTAIPAAQSETRTAAVAVVATISNVETRTIIAANLLNTYSATEKESLLNVTLNSAKSAVVNVSTDIPDIKMVVTATKSGSKPIVFNIKTNSEGDGQIKTSKNLTGFTVTLSANGVKLDSDKAIKK